MSAKTALTMAHPAVSANGQPNHALARRSEREYRADCRFRSHDVPWHNRRYGVPAPKSGRNPFSLFLFGFRLISLMSPVTALMRAARLATRSEMLVIISDGVMFTSFPDITIIL